MNYFLLVADGACSKNPGPGGYGTIVATPDEYVEEFGGGENQTTNNRMELMGFYRGLQEIGRLSKDAPLKKIHVILDSSYVINGSEKFVWNWAKNGWKTTTGEVKNQDLWELILKELRAFKAEGFEIHYEQVKGHSGHDANERVDEISVQFCRMHMMTDDPLPELYKGPLSEYSVNLKSPPKDSTPFQKTYLSYVGGQLLRHGTWAECEAVVKGKAGAKFKKVSSRQEEAATLKSWGLK